PAAKAEIEAWADDLLQYGFQKWEQEDLDAAIAILQQVPLDLAKAPDAQDLIYFAHAQRLATANDDWVPTYGDLLNLVEAMEAVKRIEPSSPFYAQAQASLTTWEHKLDDVKQLYAASLRDLRQVWGGIGGERFYAELRGMRVHRPEEQRRHFSHSHILPPRTRTRSGAFAVIHRLTQKAAMRMRHEDYFAGSLQIGVRYDFTHKWRDETHFFETQENRIFLKMLNTLWERMPRGLGEPCQVWVVFGDLVPRWRYIPPLFPSWHNARRLKLDQTMDALNRRYGTRAVYYAAAHEGRNEAPMRIAFDHIPDVEVERD
ncbi:MAG: hypothetical protein AAGF10_06295, partial [Verrucomicrobiota bacterium]